MGFILLNKMRYGRFDTIFLFDVAMGPEDDVTLEFNWQKIEQKKKKKKKRMRKNPTKNNNYHSLAYPTIHRTHIVDL